jgi:hypothetical protein
MRRDELFKSKYWKASDVPADITVKIRQSTTEILGEEREEKLVVYFVGKQKGLVCNLTNFNTIARICGSEETNDWIGQNIVLTTEPVTFRGQTALAIRVRAPATNAETRPATPAPTPSPGGYRDELNDEIPFDMSWE